MQAISLTPSAPAAPGGQSPAETPRGGAAFDRALKDAGEAGSTEETEVLAEDPTELEVDPAAPDLDLPDPPSEPVPQFVWPTAFGMPQMADGLTPDAPAILSGADVAAVPSVVEPPPVGPTGAPVPGLASPPAQQLATSPAPSPPVLPLPATEEPVLPQPPQATTDRVTIAAPPAAVPPLVTPKLQQREAVVPGFWTLRTRELPTEGITASTPMPGAVAPAALPTPSPQAMPILPPPSVTEVAIDLLLPPEPEMHLAAPGTVAHAQPAMQVQTAPGLPPTLAADLSALIARRPDGPVELTLSPEELGRLRISLTQEGNGLLVTVQVERADTLDLLRRNADMLLQEIRAAGFSGGSFSFSGWGSGASGGTGPQSFTARSEAPPPPAPPPAMAESGLDLRL